MHTTENRHEPASAAGEASAARDQPLAEVAQRPLVVIPTYNERENLESDRAWPFASTCRRRRLLIIDDASPDGTGDIAEGLRGETRPDHVLHRPGKLGLGTAYIAGFRYALQSDATCVFEMDADFSHDPRYLPTLLAPRPSATTW